MFVELGYVLRGHFFIHELDPKDSTGNQLAETCILWLGWGIYNQEPTNHTLNVHEGYMRHSPYVCIWTQTQNGSIEAEA